LLQNSTNGALRFRVHSLSPYLQSTSQVNYSKHQGWKHNNICLNQTGFKPGYDTIILRKRINIDLQADIIIAQGLSIEVWRLL
jgi:hypothetical protein